VIREQPANRIVIELWLASVASSDQTVLMPLKGLFGYIKPLLDWSGLS
jgi:hypothetical protein